MKPNLVPTFNYAAVDDPEWLRRKTERLRGHMTLVAENVVRIGLELLAVKERLELGTFRQWCRAELPMSASKIKLWMRVARVFGAVKQIDQFSPSALYVLCWPSAPQAARQAAIVMVENGESVSNKVARELISEHTPRLPADDEFETVVESKSEVRLSAPREHSLDERNWANFHEALSEYGMLHFTRIEDTENDEVEWSATGYPVEEGKLPVHFTRSDPGDLIAALLGDERLKVCPTCGVELPAGKFCFNQLEPDGRNRICRVCESTRRKKGRAAERTKRQPQPESA